jgi:cytoskeletal protein CcmA (bactofilin family)
MKKTLMLFSIFSVLTIFGKLAIAQNELEYIRTPKDSEELIVLEEDEVIDRDFITAGETVELYGTVNGDVYAAGGRVVVRGTINGDLLVAGGQVIIDGVVTQDVRVFGGDVNIRGDIGKNLTFGAGDVYIAGPANIAGSIVAGAGNVEIEGTVAGNILMGAGNLIISGDVGGDIDAGAGAFRLSPTATVGGHIAYWSEEDASISEGATVTGAVKKIEQNKDLTTPDMTKIKEGMYKAKHSASKVLLTVKFIAAVVTGLLLQRLLPGFFARSAEAVSNKTLGALGLGFLVLFMTPIALILLLITVIGAPLFLIVLFKYILEIYFAKIAVSFWAGERILGAMGSKDRRGWALVTGLVAYYILANLPIIGGFTKILSLLIGLGAIVIACRNMWKDARSRGVV